MKNLYAVFAHLSLPAWSALSVEEKIAMLGDSDSSQHFRVRLCAQKAMKGGRSTLLR
jgi:hypothetical protein